MGKAPRASQRKAADPGNGAEHQYAPLLLCPEKFLCSVFEMRNPVCCIFLEAWIPAVIRKETGNSSRKRAPFCLHVVIQNFSSYSLGCYRYSVAVSVKQATSRSWLRLPAAASPGGISAG